MSDGEVDVGLLVDCEEALARLTRERDEALAEARTLRNAAVDLQAEIERLREHHKVAVDWWMQEAQSVKPLTKEVERLRKDAERYLWLREATTDDSGDVELRVWVGGEDGDWKWPTTPDSVDAIIDAAREGE